MRILFWADGFWPRIGGIETQAIQFIHAMQTRGHEYLVIAQKDHPEHLDEEIYSDISILRLDFEKLISQATFTEFEAMRDRIKNIINAFKPDIVHLNIAVGKTAFMFAFIQRLFNVPVILTLHSISLQDSGMNFVTKKIIKLADVICCVSHSVLDTLRQYSPDDAKRAICIYNGLALPDILPTPLEFHRPVLFCIGRLSEEKGFHYAIAAFKKIKNEFPACQLKIVGSGPEEAKLHHFVKQLQLEDSVDFLGSANYTDIPNNINQATIVLMPSTMESFGLVALEAAQMQRPVIASDVGGLPEVVVHHETGMLIPPRDVAALVSAITLLLNNPDLSITLGENGRKRACRKFTISCVADAYDQIYSNALSSTQSVGSH